MGQSWPMLQHLHMRHMSEGLCADTPQASGHPTCREGCDNGSSSGIQVGLVFSIYSFASVAASPALGRCVQLGYIRRVTLLLAGLLVVSRSFSHINTDGSELPKRSQQESSPAWKGRALFCNTAAALQRDQLHALKI